MEGRPLTLVVCGAPLAARAGDMVDALKGAGWSLSIVATDAASQWWSAPPPDGRLRPEQVVAFPLTFNTANKVVAGVMDTPACGVLCDAFGARVPITAVPMVNDRLWNHPIWPSTLRALVDAGVRLVDAGSGTPDAPTPVVSGRGPEVVAAFEPRWVLAALA